jgi:hypothetical protein
MSGLFSNDLYPKQRLLAILSDKCSALRVSSRIQIDRNFVLLHNFENMRFEPGSTITHLRSDIAVDVVRSIWANIVLDGGEASATHQLSSPGFRKTDRRNQAEENGKASYQVHITSLARLDAKASKAVSPKSMPEDGYTDK